MGAEQVDYIPPMDDGDQASDIPRLFDTQTVPQHEIFGTEGENAGAGDECEINDFLNTYHEKERLENENCNPEDDLDKALDEIGS